MNRNFILLSLLAFLVTSGGVIYYLQQQNNKLQQKISSLEQKNTAATQSSAPKSNNPFENPVTDPMAATMPAQKELTVVKFERLKHDFGRIKVGDVPRTSFEFTNSGDKPLLISSAVASCGCTVANWPKGPIEPGQSSKIDVSFDSNKKSGEVTKTVTVTANTNPAQTILYVKATVIPNQ